MRLAARPHAFQRGHVLLHRHDSRAGQFLDERVPFHVIAVGMTAQDDLDVGETEPELFHRLAEQRDGFLEVGVDEDMPLRRRHEKRALDLGADE